MNNPPTRAQKRKHPQTIPKNESYNFNDLLLLDIRSNVEKIFVEMLNTNVPEVKDQDSFVECVSYFTNIKLILSECIQKKITLLNKDYLNIIMGQFESFRIKNDSNPLFLQNLPGCKLTFPSLIYIVVLNLQILKHQLWEDERDEDEDNDNEEEEEPPHRDSTHGGARNKDDKPWYHLKNIRRLRASDFPILVENFLSISNEYILSYSLGEFEMAMEAILLYVREIQSPNKELYKYLDLLEIRLAKLYLFSFDRITLNCGSMRDRVHCNTETNPPPPPSSSPSTSSISSSSSRDKENGGFSNQDSSSENSDESDVEMEKELSWDPDEEDDEPSRNKRNPSNKEEEEEEEEYDEGDRETTTRHGETTQNKKKNPKRVKTPVAYVIKKERINYYAAIFSSLRHRLNRYFYYESSAFALINVHNYFKKKRKSYQKFKEYVLKRAIYNSSVEYKANLNTMILNGEIDACNEKICQYGRVSYNNQKDIKRATFLRIVFREHTNAAQNQDFSLVLNDVQNLAEFLSSKHEYYGKTWRNDLALIDLIRSFFTSGFFSSDKPKWLENFVFWEREAEPTRLQRMSPILIQRFGRFDVLDNDTFYPTRSAFKAIYVWLRIVLYKYKNNIGNFRLNKLNLMEIFHFDDV